MSQLEFGTKFLQSTIVGSRHIGNFVAITPLFFLSIFSVSYAFIHIHEYSNYEIRKFYHFDQMAMSQLLFDTKFCKIG